MLAAKLHRPHTQLMVRHVVAAISLLCLFILIGCSSPRHRQNFGDLAKAERIEIILNREGPLPPITDRSKIENTAAFFNRYREGWVTMLGGGGAPLSMRFIKDGEVIGSFGVGETFLSVGSSARYPPQPEITAMVRGLGLRWPAS
jgi:hypothetical protein